MESYYRFEEKSFFWHSSFLVTAFHISYFSYFFFQAAGGILKVESVKAGAGERERERQSAGEGGLGRAVLTGKQC